jgi:hypothetical protein
MWIKGQCLKAKERRPKVENSRKKESNIISFFSPLALGVNFVAPGKKSEID